LQHTGRDRQQVYDWRQRYGSVNEHNGWIPRDFWRELWAKEAIIDFHRKNPLEGYRRLTFISKRIGWHTFRHSYATLLKANDEGVKTEQESLRHASS